MGIPRAGFLFAVLPLFLTGFQDLQDFSGGWDRQIRGDISACQFEPARRVTPGRAGPTRTATTHALF